MDRKRLNLLNQAVFTYSITPCQDGRFFHSVYCPGLGLYVNATKDTQVQYGRQEKNEMILLGLCVDAYGEYEREEILDQLLSRKWKNPKDLFCFCDRLAGKYIIMGRLAGKSFLFGDATNSIPIHYGYHKEGHFYASPFDKMTADYLGACPDEMLLAIRKGAAPVQPMPGDLTPYREVKCLLPNHILDMDKGKVQRVLIGPCPQKDAKLFDLSIGLCQNIYLAYQEAYELLCPLTSGYDSRVVLAIASSCGDTIPCFTWKQKGYTAKTGDIKIPKEICQRKKLPYRQLESIKLPREYFEEIEALAGLINARETVEEAYIFQSQYSNKARINGNIIGQIGKSSVMNATPDWLVNPSFLQCKLHNVNKDCRPYLKSYLKALKGKETTICDLAAWELRCGRWAGQEEALYSLCGMKSLCIFNCRALIRLWLSYPRKKRIANGLHIGMLKGLAPDLLSYPFNPDSRTRHIKSHWLPFYLATYGKQAILRLKKKVRK